MWRSSSRLIVVTSAPSKTNRARKYPRGRIEQPGRREGECRLARARLARHAHDFAGVHRETHVAHRRYGWGETPAVTDGEVANLKKGAHACRLSRGFAISSTAKLSSPSDVPTSARHRPGTRSHTHSPSKMALPS